MKHRQRKKRRAATLRNIVSPIRSRTSCLQAPRCGAIPPGCKTYAETAARQPGETAQRIRRLLSDAQTPLAYGLPSCRIAQKESMMRRIVCEKSLLPLLLRERLLARRVKRIVERHEEEVRQVLDERTETKGHYSDDSRGHEGPAR
jgi:hypothetical protein